MPARGRPPSLASPLARALVDAGVSRSRAAQALGVSRGALQARLARARSRWSPGQLAVLRAILGLDESQLDALLAAHASDIAETAHGCALCFAPRDRPNGAVSAS